jgi:thiamine transporter
LRKQSHCVPDSDNADVGKRNNLITLLEIFKGAFFMNKSLRLTESAIMIAIAFVLSILTVARMPFGGSISAFSMLPVVIIAFRYRTAWGLLAALTFAVLQLVMGMRNLTFVTGALSVVTVIMLDYIVAYVMIGLSGVFRGKIKDQGIALAAGALMACALRYTCHVISGATVWAGVSIPNVDSIQFSLAYNAAYMIPETLLTVVGAYFAGKAFTLTEPHVKRMPLEQSALNNIYAAIPFSFGTIISFILLFGMMQSREGFDITAVAEADIYSWLPPIAVFAVGIIGSVILKIGLKKTQKNEII